MKLLTKILLGVFIVLSAASAFLTRYVFEGINISEAGISLSFGALGILGLVLLTINSVLGGFLFFKLLKNVSVSKMLFLTTVPATLIFAGIGYFIFNLNNYPQPEATFVRRILNVQTTNYNNLLWLAFLAVIYLAFMFLCFVFASKPISRVERAASRLSDGRVKDQIHIGGGKQFKEIEHSLNKINYNYMEKENLIKQTNLESEKFIPKQFLRFLGKSSIAELELGNQVQREVTTMFCDIKSATEVSKTLSLEENFNFINSYLNIVSPIIRRYNGFVDKYLGDGILAIFTDGESALECSGAIVRAIQIKNRQDATLPDIDARIGINTGEVILGIVGEEERKSPTIISDSVNLAARLEDINKALGTVVTFSKRTLNSLGTNYTLSYRYIGELFLDDGSGVSVFENLDIYPKSRREKLLLNKVEFEQGVRAYNMGEIIKAKEIFGDLLKKVKGDKPTFVYYNKALEKTGTHAS